MRANPTTKVVAWVVCGLGLLTLLTLVVLLLIPVVEHWDDDDFAIVISVAGGIALLLGGWALYYFLVSDRAQSFFSPQVQRTLLVLAQIALGIVLLGLIAWVTLGMGPFGLGMLVGDLLLNGWALYAFLRHRQGRQDELVQVLAASVNGRVPLAPAVRSLIRERSWGDNAREILSGLAFVILPFYGFARMCIGWASYDRLLAELARHLEAGHSLSMALRRVPGVASREVRLAAAVGERTGKLALCLQSVGRERGAGGWLEIVPRLAYPLLIIWVILGIVSFLAVAIIPKFKKIFQEFGLTLPTVTQEMINVVTYLAEYWWAVGMILTVALGFVAAVIASPTLRWHFPVLGRLYRWGMQAEVLRALGRLLAAGQTVPQALDFLGESRDLPSVVRVRLDAALTVVEQGGPLADALARVSLLPESMVPLVRAAERVNNLPWALGELGDHQAGRAFRLVRRLSLVVAPLLIVAVGALVAIVVLGMFMPLIKLLAGLSE